MFELQGTSQLREIDQLRTILIEYESRIQGEAMQVVASERHALLLNITK